jgi:sulfatase maturation enzyme AslB (radical SAM superfamily)
MKLQNVILYGAGRMAQTAYQRLKDEYNLVCFADKSESKQGTETEMNDGRKMLILSLTDALNRFSDSKIYITALPPLKHEIISDLLSSALVAVEHILNYEHACLKRSCRFAEDRNIVFLDNQKVSLCSVGENVPHFIMDKNASNNELFDNLNRLRESIIDSLNNDDELPECKNCPHIKTDYYWESKQILKINFATGNVCQFKCIYCGWNTDFSLQKRENIEQALSFILYLKHNNHIDKNASFVISNGEITVNPLRNEIFNVFDDVPVTFFSNCEIFSDEIANLLSKNKGSIVTSLDAGTPKTFFTVKGKNSFEKTANTIRKYGKYGEITLKYIILPGINDNTADVMGFINLAVEVNANILISRDYYKTEEFDANIESCLKTIEMIILNAKTHELTVYNNLNIFNPFSKYHMNIEELFKN